MRTNPIIPMLRSLCLLGVALTLLLSGCAMRHYDVTLNNGAVIGAKGKPRQEAGYWIFTDMEGNQQQVPTHRIREIAPHVAKSKRSPFNNYGAK